MLEYPSRIQILCAESIGHLLGWFGENSPQGVLGFACWGLLLYFVLGVVIIFLSPCILVVAALSGSTIVPSMQGDLPALVVAALSGSNCAEQGENVAEPERQDNNYMHTHIS